MTQKFLHIWDELNIIGKQILDIKQKMFSMNIFTLFKKSDYIGYNSSLISLCTELNIINIDMESNNPNLEKSKIEDLRTFAKAMVNYAHILIRMNEKLEQKCRGKVYPADEYAQDLEEMDSANKIIVSSQKNIFL